MAAFVLFDPSKVQSDKEHFVTYGNDHVKNLADQV